MAETGDFNSFGLINSSNSSDGLQNNGTLAAWEFWGYAVAIPIICTVGIISNSLSLVVMSKVNFKESLYVYLKVLSAADLATVTLILFSAVARGTNNQYYWLEWIDVFVHLPIGSFSSTISILTLMAVTLERLLVIRFTVNSLSYRTKNTARKVCMSLALFSFFFNIPYYSSYYMDGWEIVSSEFTQTLYYDVHNWIRFILLGLIPGIFLIFGNILFIIYLSKYHRNFRHNSKGRSSNAHTSAEQSKPTGNGGQVLSLPEIRLTTFNSPTQDAKEQLGRRNTLGTITDNDVLLQINLSKRTNIFAEKCTIYNRTEEHFTIDLKNASICFQCTRLKDSRIADQLDKLQCCCGSQQRSLSLPLLAETCSDDQKLECGIGQSKRKMKKEEISALTSSGFGGSFSPEEESYSPGMHRKSYMKGNFQNDQRRKRNRINQHHQRRVTLVLVAMIFSFLIGETPSHLVSRSTTTSYTFSGDVTFQNQKPFKIMKLVITILMSMHYSGNFFLYLGLNKRFAKAMRQILQGWPAITVSNLNSRST